MEPQKTAPTDRRWSDTNLREALAVSPRSGSITGTYMSAVLGCFEPFDQASRDQLGGLISASSGAEMKGSARDRLKIILYRTMEVIDPFRLMVDQFLRECPLPWWTTPRTSKKYGYDLMVSDAELVTEAWNCAVRVVESDDDPWFSTKPPYTSYESCLTIAGEVQGRRRRYRKVTALPRLNEQATAVGHVVAAIGFLSEAAELGSPKHAVFSLKEMETLVPGGKEAALSVALDVIDEMRTGKFHKSARQRMDAGGVDCKGIWS